MEDVLERKVWEMHDRYKLAPSQIDEKLRLAPGTSHSVMVDIWKSGKFYRNIKDDLPYQMINSLERLAM